KAKAAAEAEAKRKAAEAAREKAEAEAREKAEEEAKARAAAEARRKAAEEAKARAMAEAKREMEEEAKVIAAAEARKKAAEDARRKAELEEQINNERREQTEREANKWANRYIKPRVEGLWLKPPAARGGLSCIIQVRTLGDGTVVEARVVKSSGDATFDRSAESAVKKASPLPMPSDPRVAAELRSFTFKFDPSG
ncbi:cell envelope integrity protein TolA, partial [Methylococcus sp. BF19-07]